jgi:hypothetical protein
LRTHIKQDKACIPSDLDPEDGVDRDTISKMIDRKRACGPTEQDQWEDLFKLLFPDDPMIPSYGMLFPNFALGRATHAETVAALTQSPEFTPVIESHELLQTCLERLNYFQPHLQDLVPTNEAIEILCSRIRDDLIQTLEFSNMRAREMDYVNRNSANMKRTSGANTSWLAYALAYSSPRDSAIGLDNLSARSSAVFPVQWRPPSTGSFVNSRPAVRHRQSFTDSASTGRPSSAIFQQPTPQTPFRRLSSNLLQQPRTGSRPQNPYAGTGSTYPTPMMDSTETFAPHPLAPTLRPEGSLFLDNDLIAVGSQMENTRNALPVTDIQDLEERMQLADQGGYNQLYPMASMLPVDQAAVAMNGNFMANHS